MNVGTRKHQWCGSFNVRAGLADACKFVGKRRAPRASYCSFPVVGNRAATLDTCTWRRMWEMLGFLHTAVQRTTLRASHRMLLCVPSGELMWEMYENLNAG